MFEKQKGNFKNPDNMQNINSAVKELGTISLMLKIRTQLNNEKPVHSAREYTTLATPRESPRAAMKTQCHQK